MKIDFTTPLHQLDGSLIPARALRDGEDPAAAPAATLGDICRQAVFADFDEDGRTAGRRAELFALGLKINAGGVVDLDVTEVGLVKARIEKVYPPIITGQCWNLLEGRLPFGETAAAPASPPKRKR